MSWRSRVTAGFKSLFRRRQDEHEIEEELRAYFEEVVEARTRDGVPLDVARREARVALGNLHATKDGMRDIGWETSLHGAWQDLRHAVRRLRATPGFTLVAILTLALGIGANAAIFSLMNGLLLKPMPVPNIDRLVALARIRAGSPRPEFALTADQRRALETSPDAPIDSLIMSDPLLGALSAAGQSEMTAGELVSGNFFEVLGLRPRAGRLLLPADDDTSATISVVISEGLWRRWFDADPGAIGSTARMAGWPLTIVGVVPDHFNGTWLPTMKRADFWVPISAKDRLRTIQGVYRAPGDPHRTFARLRPGATVEQAAAAVGAIGQSLQPDERSVVTLTALPATRAMLFDDFARPGLALGSALVAVSGLVFLIACANLMNLLLARGAERQPEMAIRLATGASRGRVFRAVLAEVGLLTGLASAAGLLVTLGLTQLMTRVPLPDFNGISIRFDPTPDLFVFGFAMGIAVIAALAVGLLPAWQATRTDPAKALTSGAATTTASRRGRRLRTALVAVQVGMSVVLVLLAGLYVRSARMATHFDPGYAAARLTTASIDLTLHGIDEPEGRTVQARLLDAAQRTPGVERAALVSGLPALRQQNTPTVLLEGEAPGVRGLGRLAGFVSVSQGFFAVTGIEIRRGRSFAETDAAGSAPVVIVSETAAATFWPNENPIGRKLQTRPDGPWREVIGLAADTATSLRSDSRFPFIYLPAPQEYNARMSVIVRGGSASPDLTEPLRYALRQEHPEIALFDVGRVLAVMAPVLMPMRIAALVLSVLGLLGFGIAILGVYGVLSYVVSQRTRELGIRRALGATSRHIHGVVLGAGLRTLLWGAIPGVAVGLIGSTFLSRLLYGVAPHDPLTFIVVPLVLVGIGFGAAGLVARKAARVDPNVALRNL
jgi:predicted permease